MKKLNYALVALALCFFHCNSPDLEQLDFFGVELQGLSAEGLNGIRLTGQVIGQGETAEGECGFLWSYDRKLVEQKSPGATWIPLSFPAAGSNGKFDAVIDNLERGQTVWVRAYSKSAHPEAGERMVFSENIEEFTIAEIVALTGTQQVFNNTALLFGQLRGVDTLGKKVDAHGHVISPTAAQPVPGCNDCLTSNRGSTDDDAVFASQITGLKFNTTYYARAYAVAGSDTFYSTRTDTFRVRDGWVRIADFPTTYSEGVAVPVFSEGRAYMGFGCQKADGPTCTADELADQREFWTFDPNALDSLGKWTTAKPVFDFVFSRTNVAAFVIDNDFYAIFGEFFSPDYTLIADFCKYDPDIPDSPWSEISFDDNMFIRRSGAVAFVLNGKGYVGSGRDKNDKELSDFWEYNPATQLWRRVADMPAGAARFEAVAFTLKIGNFDYGYVGTGQFGPTLLRDFWRFRPPVDDTDTGEWEPVEPLPPEAPARYQAIAFSINNFGYIATGYHPTLGYLNDTWQYDPMANKWTQKTPFQGVARTNAVGFALSGYGYLGTGNTKVQLNGGLSSSERSLPDFWRYIPEQ